jgi:ATP-binding cassette subfamily E protein 1
VVRTGGEAIVFSDGKPVISEELCEGCGICIKKCPFGAINIVGLPKELGGKETHRYGVNRFVLYGLPIPKRGKVTGILGQNGTGKTTAVKILSGILKPNPEAEKEEKDWEEIIKHYAGSELQEYFRCLARNIVKISHKPQYIDQIPKIYEGRVSDLLCSLNSEKVDRLTMEFGLEHVLHRNIKDVSGGELQRLAIIACMAKEAEFYFFDEITPYLDIYQRMRAAKLIRGLASENGKTIMVVEHDIAILDMLADVVHISYGTPGVYGVIAHPRGARVGINEYLSGYLSKENIRIRGEWIKFDTHAPKRSEAYALLSGYEYFVKEYDSFMLEANAGKIRESEVLGIVGPNGIGKSTFVSILAGVTEPSHGSIDLHIKISYKPQYIKTSHSKVRDVITNSSHVNEIIGALRIGDLLDQKVLDLSGGELQMVAIASCLSNDADLYILDEPSAHLDVEQRALAAKTIRRYAKSHKKAAMVVDHDIYMIDLLSDRLLVFSGESSVRGFVHEPFEMREGMNKFLSELGITFRRDETGRPRINKLDSRLDREQKDRNEYYFV